MVPLHRMDTDRRRALCISALVVVVATVAVQLIRALRFPLGTDFVGVFDVGGGILRSGRTDLYDPAAQFAVARQLLGAVPVAGFHSEYVDHPLLAWIFQPASRLPYETGLALFLLISLGVLVLSAVLALPLLGDDRRSLIGASLLGLAIFSLPASLVLATAQIDSLFLLGLVLSIRLMLARRPLLAGLLLGVPMLKPQLVWLVVPLLVIARQWRAILGAGLAALAVVGTAFLLLPVAALAQWPANVMRIPLSVASSSIGLPTAIAPLAGTQARGAEIGVALLCAVTALALAWRARDRLRSRPELCIALGVAASLVAAPYGFPYDLVLLAPALLVWAAWDGIRFPLAAVLAMDVAFGLDQVLPGPAAQIQGLVLGAVVVLLFWRMASEVPARPRAPRTRSLEVAPS